MPNSDGSRTAVTEYFGDGEHVFDLVNKGWTILTELERSVGSLIPFFGRVLAQGFRISEIREVVRLALIGGGASPKDAAHLVETYFDMHPIADNLHIALSAVGGALYGVSEDGKVLEAGDDD